jgi:hypothetical protein
MWRGGEVEMRRNKYIGETEKNLGNQFKATDT